MSIIVYKKNKINHNNSDFIQEESSSPDKGTKLGQTIDTESDFDLSSCSDVSNLSLEKARNLLTKKRRSLNCPPALIPLNLGK